MRDLILHHFDYSPFAEKARLALGFKGLTWQSVQIPMIMPKPDLMPLTGGYRKTPVLQMGADIYCDTRLIARELERRYPSPTLFPAGNRGLSLALTQWADTAFFEAGAGLSMALTAEVPEAVIEDRKRLFTFMDFGRLKEDVPHMMTQLRAETGLLEQQLADGRLFLLGAEPGWADIACYFPLWMVRNFVPSCAAMLDANTCTVQWERRVKAFGHGQRSEIDAQTALDIALESTADPGGGVDEHDALRLVAGTPVSVSPSDFGKVPVTGDLVTLTTDEVAVKRTDPRVGEIVTHFPRIGYRIEKAAH